VKNIVNLEGDKLKYIFENYSRLKFVGQKKFFIWLSGVGQAIPKN